MGNKKLKKLNEIKNNNQRFKATKHLHLSLGSLFGMCYVL